MAYDADTGDLTLIQHSGGYVLDVAAVAGRITGVWLRGRRVTLPDGEADEFLREPDVPLIRYCYDAAGRLTEVVNSTGLPTKFTYDGQDRLTSWEDRNGTWYAYTYDDVGRVVRTNGSAGCLDGVITYDADNRVTVEENSLGARTTYHLDDGYRMVKVVDPLGHATSYSWDRYDRKLSETDPLGHTTSWSYDEAGHPVQVTGPDGAVTRVAYDEQGLGLPVRVTQADGTEWVYERDETGQPTRVVDPAGNATTYTWNDRGALTAVTDPLGNTTTITPGPAGLPAAVTDPTGATTTYERDGLGRATAVTDALGGLTQLVWSVEGDMVRQTAPDGTTREWIHDGEGNVVREVDELGQITTTDYTYFDLLSVRTLPDGSKTVFAYDTELRLTAVTNALGDVWSYTYDDAGHLVGESDYAGRALAYQHDPLGRLVEKVNGAGESIRYRRDSGGRVIEQVTHSAGFEFTSTFTYDAVGRLTSATNPDASVEVARDPLGRLIAETVNGRTLALDLDPLGRVLTRTTPSGDVTAWKYGASGLPESLATGGHTLAFRHDAVGHEQSRSLDTGLTITSGWDAAGRLTEQSIIKGPGSAALVTAAEHRLINRRTWTYRPDGNPVTVDDHLRGATTYDLDSLGRITRAATPQGVESYTYGANSNPTRASWHTSVPTDNGSSNRSQEEAGSPDWAGERAYVKGRVTRAGRITYEYDAQGRLTLRRVRTLSGQVHRWSYVWDAYDRLTSVVTPDGTVWRYRYDALGRRIAKQRLGEDGSVAGEITFTWQGPVLVEQSVQSASGPDGARSTTTWTYSPGSWRPLTQRHTGGQGAVRFRIVTTDLVGSPTELLTPVGDISWTRSATNFDVPLTGGADLTVCPLRFPGQYYDPELDQNYNHHRTYDPATASYVTSDPLGIAAGPNPYAYVPNPTVVTDPLGLMRDYPVVTNAAGQSVIRVYRTMSDAHFANLESAGFLLPTAETFISPTRSFSESYSGRLAQIEIDPPCLDDLLGVGVRDTAANTVAQLPSLPVVGSGWTRTSAFFKSEGPQINIGLGRGSALDVFNSGIINIRGLT